MNVLQSCSVSSWVISLSFAAAVRQIIQALWRIVVLELRQQVDQMMDAAIGLLRARFEQIEKLFVVSEKFTD